MVAQLQSVQVTNRYENTIMTGNARGILGNFYQTHHHIYSDSPPDPIDIDSSSTAELLHTVLAAVDKYKRTQNEAAWAEAGEELGTLIAETLSEPSSRASVAAPFAGTHQLTSVTGNVQKGRERSQLQIIGVAQSQPDTSPEQEIAQQIAPANTICYPSSSTSAATTRESEVSELSKIARAPETTMLKNLSSKYRQRGGSFFETGRVFATLWSEYSPSIMTRAGAYKHELTGWNPHVTLSPYGTGVYTYLRRFTVVKNRHGYCSCVAITTYGGKGLLDRGLTSREIKSHAIGYDSNSGPTRLRDEPVTHNLP